MTNIFLYYNFGAFFKDESGAFNHHEICFSELNAKHFLVFEKNNDVYNLYVSKFSSKKAIGKEKPEIVELLVKEYNKSLPEHRIILRRYFE
ncbi:MAG: hypothetical protein HWD85_10170 [Flavobacteriaceae bacterium]|nr:hypothetical protein [Flavobacteriaceae bacterium]